MGKSCSDSSTTIASWIRRLSLSLLLVGWAIAPAWGVKRAEIIDSPRVNKDRGTVRLRVKIYDQNNRPVNGLEPEDLRVIVCPQEGECQTLDDSEMNLRVPGAAELPPAWIILLLDFSGSMKRSDSRGTTKLEGAISAIRKFNQNLAESGANTYLAIVPFSRGGKNCSGNPVRRQELDKFELAGNIKLENTLRELEAELDNLCGATDIYGPVGKAVEFLGDPKEERFYPPEDANQPRPRLSIILLSDGYHSIHHGQGAKNEVAQEGADFNNLLKLLKRYPDITIHTLGYGLTPQQLQAKYNLSGPPTIADVGKVAPADFTNPGRLAQITVPAEEFVDQKRLQQIAEATGAIAEFSGNAEAISSNLKEFLEALQGEYEISYMQPTKADRGSQHTVTIEVKDSAVRSDPKPYVFPWVGPTLPRLTRIVIILSVLAAIGLLGVLPFWLSAQSIKQKY